MSFLSGVENLNSGFWPCEGSGFARISGLLVDGLVICFSVDFVTYQPLRR